MGPIGRAIDDCMFRIPRRILETVFVNRQRWSRAKPISVSDAILHQVVKPRVLLDCNIVGGTEMYISLDGVAYEQVDELIRVYDIPKAKTGGRSIISVLDMTFAEPNRTYGYTNSLTMNNNTMLQAGQAMMDVHSSAPMMSTHRVQLIGENVVMVRDMISLPANIAIRVLLANDENLSHIQVRSYKAFERLVELAVKSFIYNEYIVEMDVGEIYAGMNLGAFKTVIDGYADSEEMYQNHLREVWTKVAFMNDNEAYTRLINSLIGAYR